MIIKTHSVFDKHFEKRTSTNKKLVLKFRQRLNLLIVEPTNPILRNHQLIGARKSLQAFSITGDIRVVYRRISRNEIILMDIGTHNQVY